MSTIIIPPHLRNRSEELHRRIGALDLGDELVSDEEPRIVHPDEDGLVVGAKVFDPTLPFGGRMRGADGLRVGQKYPGSGYDPGCPPMVDDPPCGQPPIIDPCTFRGGKRLCDMQKVAWSVVVAGGGTFNLQIEPTKAPYFDPKGVRANVTALLDTTLNFRALVTGVSINDTPQEGINDFAPVAPTLAGQTIAGFWTDDWKDPDKKAVPVPWGWFSNISNSYPLNIGGIALGVSPSVLLLVTFNIYGNTLSSPPQGRAAGQVWNAA